MTIFDGRTNAHQLEEIIRINAVGIDKTLGIIQIGDNLVSEKYIDLKTKLCEKFDIPCRTYRIVETNPDDYISSEVLNIVKSPEIGGVIIQLPLPRLSLKTVLDLIPLNKDLDLLSSTSMEQFMAGDTKKVPPVVRAVAYFLRTNGIDLQNKSVTVVGNGPLVGIPITTYLLSIKAKVRVLDNYKTGDALGGDLIVLCAGVPNLVNGQDILNSSSVIDFGSTILSGRTVGDLNLSSELNHLQYVSPSPGGMGPLVVRFLIMNFLGC